MRNAMLIIMAASLLLGCGDTIEDAPPKETEPVVCSLRPCTETELGITAEDKYAGCEDNWVGRCDMDGCFYQVLECDEILYCQVYEEGAACNN